MINISNFPRPEKLINKVRVDNQDLSPFELLVLKSRSFAIPIYSLGELRGEGEKDKQREIENLYLTLRGLDTIEDCNLKPKDKRELMDGLLFVFNEVVDRKADEPIEDLKERLGDITKKLRKGLYYQGKLDLEEDVFVEQFGKGSPLEMLKGFDTEIKGTIKNSINGMSVGMKEFLREGIGTAYNLERYCFYVAGSVGIALTEIVNNRDGAQLNAEQAGKFGEYLQMTNIIKNIREDFDKREASYIPREMAADVSIEDLMSKRDPTTLKVKDQVLEKLLHMAERNYDSAVNYVNSIPNRLSGYRAFCLIPLITARETLNLMKKSGAEAIFKGEEKAIKIDGLTFLNICTFTDKIVKLDGGATASSWLIEYKRNLQQSFIPGEYEKWAYNWLK